MERLKAEIVPMKGRELYPDARPRIIADNGPRFIPKDFREPVSLLETERTFTGPAHPRSSGKLERFRRKRTGCTRRSKIKKCINRGTKRNGCFGG
jgi:transposase InsO family protein